MYVHKPLEHEEGEPSPEVKVQRKRNTMEQTTAGFLFVDEGVDTWIRVCFLPSAQIFCRD
jgi:hypothetical protein